MKFFKRCIDSIERRPFIFGSFFLFFLIFSCFEQLLYSLYKTFLSKKVYSMFSFIYDKGTGETASLENALQGGTASGATYSFGEMFLTVVIVTLLLFALSAVVSVYFSGYFHILNISLKPNKEKVKGEFKKGLVKHYFKFTLYIFGHIVILLAAAVAAVFAIFPAVISFRMVYSGGQNGLLLTSIFLIILTAVVIAFIAAVILMYTMYMYPSLVNFKKGSFYMSRKIVNAKFWYVLPRLMLFVIMFVVWQLFMANIGYGLVSVSGAIAAFLLNAIVKTYLIFSMVFFVFFTFRQIKNALQTEEKEEDAEEINQISKGTQRTPQRRANSK